MTLYYLSEQARRILLAGNPQYGNPPLLQELMARAKQLFGDLLKKNLFENKQEGFDYVNGDLVFTFDNQPVIKDVNKNLYYSNLPSATITLPNEAGVDMVCLMHSQDRPFVKVPRNFLGISRGIPISLLESNYGYWQENKRIYYVNFGMAPPNDVMIKIIAGMDGVEYDTEINIPTDIQKAIVDGLVATFAQQGTNDPTNNSNTTE